MIWKRICVISLLVSLLLVPSSLLAISLDQDTIVLRLQTVRQQLIDLKTQFQTMKLLSENQSEQLIVLENYAIQIEEQLKASQSNLVKLQLSQIDSEQLSQNLEDQIALLEIQVMNLKMELMTLSEQLTNLSKISNEEKLLIGVITGAVGIIVGAGAVLIFSK